MRFEFLKLVMRVDTRITIIEPNCKTDVDDAISHPIDPRTAKRTRVERPAQRVDHRTRRKSVIGHLPQFFDAYRINLRVGVSIQFQAFDHLLCQRASDAFSKNRYLRGDVDSRLEVRLLVSVLVDTFVASAYTYDGIRLV